MKITPKGIISKYDNLKGNRANWENLWQETARYSRPNNRDISSKTSAGKETDPSITDSTAIIASQRFASGLYAYMCRPDEQWFHFVSDDSTLMDDEEVGAWFAKAEKTAMANMYLSNFSQEIHEDFMDLVSFGTSNLYVEAGTEYPLRFRNFDITQYVIEENAFGLIDTVIAKFEYDARQAVQAFGEDNVSEEIRKAYLEPDNITSKKKYTFLHYVSANPDTNPNSLKPTDKAYHSIYVEKDTKKVVRDGGYDIIPYAVSRFTKDPNEIYGRCPAINSLPDIRMLNSMATNYIKVNELAYKPPIAVRHGSTLNQPSLESGKIVYVRGSMWEDKPVPLMTVGDPRLALEAVQHYEDKIKESFFTDMFDYLVGGKYMTATEVEARKQSKMFLFAPMLSRIQNEKLRTIIENVFNILFNKGLFGELPDALKENPNYNIQFSGRITNALRNIESRGTQQVLALAQGIAQFDPNVLRNLDYNIMLRDEAINSGMPVNYIKPREVVQAELQAEQEQQAKMQEMQMMQQGSQALANGNKAPEQGSPTEALMQQQQQQ